MPAPAGNVGATIFRGPKRGLVNGVRSHTRSRTPERVLEHHRQAAQRPLVVAAEGRAVHQG